MRNHGGQLLMTALILYPNQLFDVELLPKVKRVYLVEEPLLFGTDGTHPLAVHKARLVLHRAAMRRYAEEVLWPNGYEVEYIECTDDVVTDTALVKAAFEGASEIVIFDPVDERISRRLVEASRALEVHVPLRQLESPNFYLKNKDIEQLFADNSSYGFVDFYQYMRERFDILIGKDYKPVGGQWMFQASNPDVLSKNQTSPGLASFGDNDYVKEAVTYVELKFPDNPGYTDSFVWPTNHDEAMLWLKDFLTHRLEGYGPHAESIDSGSVWLYHSGLSAIMNIGLLSPQEVVEETLAHAARSKKDTPIESLEGFIRQTIGWREYVRALYVAKGDVLRTKNVLGNARKLTDAWWTGTTGVLPLDTVIAKVNKFGYAHHNERLMVLGNMMLLCDIHPDEVYRWFMAHFIDAYDWVVVPNVYEISQYATGGAFGQKLPIFASNALLTVSGFEKGSWCDVWDGLFWRFVDVRRMMLKRIPRQGSLLVGRYDSMDASRKRIISYRAQDFLDICTSE